MGTHARRTCSDSWLRSIRTYIRPDHLQHEQTKQGIHRRGSRQGPAYAEAMTDSTGTDRVIYLARPNRPALVADSLEELTGPKHGVVELPQRLM